MGKDITVFYSWQSDSPNIVNRAFIKDALKEAIKRVNKSYKVEDALRDETLKLDQDTSGVPGIPDIANTIFEKIDLCSIFVPDLTYVAENTKKEKAPNPNVLIELGYAIKAKGKSQIITVMNDAFGSPKDHELPFDLKGKRWPIRYDLEPNATSGVRKEQKQSLIAALEFRIKEILGSGILSKSEPVAQEGKLVFPETKPQYRQSHYLKHDERVVRRLVPNSPPVDIRWVQGPQAFLRFIPSKYMGDRVNEDFLNLSIRPMCYSGCNSLLEMNEYGVVFFDIEKDDDKYGLPPKN